MSSKSKTDIDRVHILRLLAAEELTSEGREVLLHHLESASLEEALDVVCAHGDLGHPARVVDVLAERIPGTLPAMDATDLACRLARRFDPDAYADLACRLVPKFLAVGSDEPAGTGRWFLEFLRGCDRFNRIHTCDLRQPVVEGTGGPLGLELATLGLRYDEKRCLRELADRAARSAPQALRMWRIACDANDAELERAIRPHALAHLDLAQDLTTSPEWHVRLLNHALNWANSEAEDVHERNDALFARAEEAHSRGGSWNSMRYVLLGTCKRLNARLLELSLDEDAVPAWDAFTILRESLPTGSETAWRRFFRWAEQGEQVSPIEVRDLLRTARRPDAPDDAFWSRYTAAWDRARAGEQDRVAQLDRVLDGHLPPDTTPEVRNAQLARLDKKLFPLTSPTETVDRLLEHPPTLTSARAVIAAVREAPERLSDPRVASFAPLVVGFSHEELPDVAILGWMDDAAVANFVALHGSCGGAHLRERARAALRDRPHIVEWLLERSWLEHVLDEELRSEIRAQLLDRRWRQLVRLVGRYPDWISREDVLARAPEDLDDFGPLEELPDWVDDLLITRARTATSHDHLARITARFVDKERGRAALFEILRARLCDGSVDGGVAGLLGDVLASRNAWDTHGADVVHELLAAGRVSELSSLVFGSDYRRWEARFSEKARVVAMHLAFARGILQWAFELAQAGDHDNVERALIAAALLDPPPPFTRDLRKLKDAKLFNETCRHWLVRLHAIVDDGGGKDASVRGLRTSVDQLVRGENADLTEGEER